MEKKKYGFVQFFTIYFSNLNKLILANILFAIPLAIFCGIILLINWLFNINNNLINFLPIIFLFPFFAGITLITRNIIKNPEDISVVKLFIKGLKENLLQFLIHGFIGYIVVLFSISSLSLYWNLAQNNGFFYVLFAIALLICVMLLFMFYNLPVMTASFKLSIKDLYKNCFLMSFGEIKNNLLATVGLALLSLICVTIFSLMNNATVLIIISLVILFLFLPSTVSMITNFYVYKDMENLMYSKLGIKIPDEDDIEKERIKKNNENLAKEILDFSNIDLDENKDGNEYLYFNGKMIKRSVLINMKKNQENENG